MSRHYDHVPVQAAAEVFGIGLLKKTQRLLDAGEAVPVRVAHGYDAPCQAYFCDLHCLNFQSLFVADPDVFDDGDFLDVGIYYGHIGTTRKLNKEQYLEAMQKLGLEEAANAVALDIIY